MTDPATAPPPLAIDRVERARGDGEHVRLRLSGRRLGEEPVAVSDALLVVQLQGRRHRFPSRPGTSAEGLPGTWQLEFSLPDWAVPTRIGQAALWIGSTVVAVDPPGVGSGGDAPVVPDAPDALDAPGVPGAPGGVPDAAGASIAPPAPGSGAHQLPGEPESTPRAGPLADLLLKETVAALHAELERRSGESAQLRGALADAQSELEARTARQAALEAAHAELRHELEQLMAVVPRQREEFDDALAQARGQADALQRRLEERAEEEHRLAAERAAVEHRLAAERAALEQRLAQEAGSLREQLAAAQIARDAALTETGGLRGELERLGAELAVVREQASAHGGDLGEAQRLLADARALTEQLRGEH